MTTSQALTTLSASALYLVGDSYMRLSSIAILILSSLYCVILSSCENPINDDCKEYVQINVIQIVLPDTAGFLEPMAIEMELIYGCGDEYTGIEVRETEQGCQVIAVGERETCMPVPPTIETGWQTAYLTPNRKGMFQIEIENTRLVSVMDSVYVK